jgi:hypothetical protein
MGQLTLWITPLVSGLSCIAQWYRSRNDEFSKIRRCSIVVVCGEPEMLAKRHLRQTFAI